MENKLFSAKALCRSGVIAALYVALTVSFGSLSFLGGLQVRPSEGLCMLPLIYPEAVLALTVGCFISNLFSPFAVFAVTLGVGGVFRHGVGSGLGRSRMGVRRGHAVNPFLQSSAGEK